MAGPRLRDAGLAVGLLVAVTGLTLWLEATVRPTWLLCGALVTVLAEALAYRRPAAVRAWFDRTPVLGAALLLAICAIIVGAALAPDVALSGSIGALGTYCFLLAFAAATVWSPDATS